MFKKLIVHVISFVFLLAIFSNSVFAFSDVKNNTNYSAAIEWMFDNGVIHGYPDGKFRPDQCVNRAEFLKMLYASAEVDVNTYSIATANVFPDVDRMAWYHHFVAAAYLRGVVHGYPDGRFRPDLCVNRAEAVKMAVLEFKNDVIPSVDSDEEVTDIEASQWFYKYIRYAFKANLVGRIHVIANANGYRFVPDGNMSRAEVAELLYRMKTVIDKNVEKYESGTSPDDIEEDDNDDEIKAEVVTLADIGVKFNWFPFEENIKVDDSDYDFAKIYLEKNGKNILIGLVSKPVSADRGGGWGDLLRLEDFDEEDQCDELDGCDDVLTNVAGHKMLVWDDLILDSDASFGVEVDANAKEHTYVFEHPWKWHYTLILTDKFLNEENYTSWDDYELLMFKKMVDEVTFLPQPAYIDDEEDLEVTEITEISESSNNYFTISYKGKYDSSCQAVADVTSSMSGNIIEYNVITRQTSEFCKGTGIYEKEYSSDVVIDAEAKALAAGNYTININGETTLMTVE